MSYIPTPIGLILLQDLFQSRAATQIQIERLAPPEVRHLVSGTLGSLEGERLVRRRDLQLGGQTVYCLSRAGFDLGVEHGVIRAVGGYDPKRLWRRLEVSDMTLLHELEVVDVRIAIETTARRTPAIANCRVVTSLAGEQFEGVDGKRFYPDGRVGFSLLPHAGKKLFYLELDRGTEALRRITQKVRDYRALVSRGGQPFRVVILVPSTERRNNIAWLLAKEFPECPNFVMIATLEDVRRDAFGDVFLTPGSLKGMPGTLFPDPVLGRGGAAYRRSKEREDLIGRFARKRSFAE